VKISGNAVPSNPNRTSNLAGLVSWNILLLAVPGCHYDFDGGLDCHGVAAGFLGQIAPDERRGLITRLPFSVYAPI
jgi:hypothetical protein